MTSGNVGACDPFVETKLSPFTHGRMFATAIGIPEDPVTGNANGPLGAYLVHHKILKATDGSLTFKGK